MIIPARSVNWRRTGSYINNHVVKFRWPVVQASDLPKFAKKPPATAADCRACTCGLQGSVEAFSLPRNCQKT